MWTMFLLRMWNTLHERVLFLFAGVQRSKPALQKGRGEYAVAELFDTHCHLSDLDFDQDRDAVLERMHSNGVTRCAVIGYDVASSKQALLFAERTPGVFCAVGIHPEHADTVTPETLSELQKMASNSAVRAIGEIGIDLHWESNPSLKIQQNACVQQLELASILSLPVCFHVRDAQMEMLCLLKEHKRILTGGIMHCFSGSWEVAKEYLKLGFYISFAGPVTFKKAPKLQEAARNVPLDRLLIETDSPYMAPEPVRGRRNEPGNVRYVCEKIAELRGMPYEELAERTTGNACRLFRV